MSNSSLPLSAKTSPSSPSKDFSNDGFHVIRAENIVIIEDDLELTNGFMEPQKHIQDQQSIIDVEMPESGIVSRLKGKFAETKVEQPTFRRSRSQENVLETDAKPVETLEKENVPSSPSHPRTFSLPNKPQLAKQPSQVSTDVAKQQPHDFYTPRLFSQKREIQKVTSPTRRVSAPVLNVKSRSSPEKKVAAREPHAPARQFSEPAERISDSGASDNQKVDITNLHSAGSPKHSTPPGFVPKTFPVVPVTENQVRKLETPSNKTNLLDPVSNKPFEEITIKSDLPTSSVDSLINLHSGSEEVKLTAPKPFSNLASKKAQPARTGNNQLPTVKKEQETKNAVVLKNENKNKNAGQQHAVTPPPRSLHGVKTTYSSSKPPAEPLKVEGYKKKDEKFDINHNQKGFQVIDLGRTSLDPSQLTSKGAIRANEIMKNSKTIRIVPNRSQQQQQAQQQPQKATQKSNNLSQLSTKSESTKPPVQTDSNSITRNHNDVTFKKPAKNQGVQNNEVPSMTTNKPAAAETRKNFNSKSLPASSIDNEVKSKITINNNKEGFQIVDLGRTSLDPSQLTSKGAIMANEIMQNSKTIRIIPKGSKQQQQQPPPQQQKLAQLQPQKPAQKIDSHTSPSTKSDSTKPVVAAEKTATPKSLPVSSVDDIIMSEKPVTKSAMPAAASHSAKSIANLRSTGVKPGTKADTKPNSVHENSNSTSSTGVTNSWTKPRSQGSGFGTQRKSGFGGKSFVIDPKKFAKSSAPPITTQNTQKPPSVSNGHVINPGQSASITSANQATEDGAVQSKGKRKLTVDQIQVIGGYVKLKHSTLSKSRPNHKHRVNFKLECLEDVFEYPSEKSLTRENGPVTGKPMLNKLPGSGKESSLGRYTPKYLLSMKEDLKVDDEEEETSSPASKDQVAPEPSTTYATPLYDAAGFSSTDSSDLLF